MNQFPFFLQDSFVILITMHNSIYFVTKKLLGSVLHDGSITDIKEENLNFENIYNIFNCLSDIGW